jgi:phage replication initiation protein
MSIHNQTPFYPGYTQDADKSAFGLPSSCNTRVKSTQGQTAFVDWFTATFKFELSPFDFDEFDPEFKGTSRAEKLQYIHHILFEVFGLPEIRLTPLKRTYKFYDWSIRLDKYGFIAWGGEKQNGTVLIDLNATGCAKVKDWLTVKYWGETYGATITRCDLAHDDYEGTTVSIAQGLIWLEQGLFHDGGRPPQPKLIDDLGTNKGKTLYVGARQGVKYCRIYEKGKQLKDKESLWVRLEVEFKKGKRIIPWEILTNPSFYLAGAYPCTAFLSEFQERIKTVKKMAGLAYRNLVKQAKTQFGRLFDVMMRVEAGDYCAVIDQLMRVGTPKSLQAFDDYWYPELEVSA